MTNAMGFPAEHWPTPPPAKKYSDGDGLEFEIIPKSEAPAEQPVRSPIEYHDRLVPTRKPEVSSKILNLALPETHKDGIKITAYLELLKDAQKKYLAIEHNFMKMPAAERDALKMEIILNLEEIIGDIPRDTPATEFGEYRAFFVNTLDKIKQS